jgi:hypothetical protein
LDSASFASVNKQFRFSPLSTMPRSFKVRYIPCPVKTCTRQFTNQGGLKNHIRMHRRPQTEQVQQLEPARHEEDVPVDMENIQDDHVHPPTSEGTKEKVAHHPLINGLPLHIRI